MMDNLTAKTIRLELKRNIGMSQLCEKNNCSEEEMVSSIFALYKKKKKTARDVISELKSNDKKIARRHVVEKPVTPKEAKTDDEPKATETEVVTETVSGSEFTDSKLPEPVPYEQAMSDLQATEKEQSDIIIGLETKHVDLASKRRAVYRQMNELAVENRELWTKIRNNRDKYVSLTDQFNEYGNSMNEISKDLRGKREAIEETRAKIEAMKIAEIFVYLDGRIENEVGIKLDDSGSDEVYHHLLEDERVQNLRLNSIRSLARTIKIVEHLEIDSVVIFEDDEVDEVYFAMQPDVADEAANEVEADKLGEA